MSSCGRAIVGESGLAAAVGRSSSDTADVIGGFIGVTFSPIARVTIETGERTFASVAFLVSPTSTRVSSVLDELGEPNTARWRLGHWSPGDSTYVEAADGEERRHVVEEGDHDGGAAHAHQSRDERADEAERDQSERKGERHRRTRYRRLE